MTGCIVGVYVSVGGWVCTGWDFNGRDSCMTGCIVGVYVCVCVCVCIGWDFNGRDSCMTGCIVGVAGRSTGAETTVPESRGAGVVLEKGNTM